jgi:hypothetical protein
LPFLVGLFIHRLLGNLGERPISGLFLFERLRQQPSDVRLAENLRVGTRGPIAGHLAMFDLLCG